jgi:hypothetical protein
MLETVYTIRLMQFASYMEENADASHIQAAFKIRIMTYVNESIEERDIFMLSWPFYDLPLAFPKDWAFNEKGDPILKNKVSLTLFEAVVEFFGLYILNELCHLFSFSEDEQDIETYGGRKLTIDSDRRIIAQQIWDYLASQKRAIKINPLDVS